MSKNRRSVINAAFFYFYSNQEIGQSFKQFHIQARSFLDLLLPAIIIALAIGIVMAFVMAVFFPHRIAGPLYRMERELKERVGDGDLTVKFSLRKGDEVGELADALNIMIEKLKLKIGKIKAASDELVSLSGNANKGGEEHIKKLSELTKKIEEAVKEFRL
ncbi:MAG: HAMP domain-containing protein [Deltaproteobacteria bacterium]|nr:HAMP domain-containing protein [Deltaproteobacteria bacterium]